MYNELTALHYAAYRPMLHDLLLEKCLNPNDKFILGLDIGCGTGQSSISLAKFCEKVIAIDPSAEMLSKAKQHSKVTYFQMNGNLDIPQYPYDIITFAGSLFYCKSQELMDKIIDLTSHNTTILVYDFNIRLEDILVHLGLTTPTEIKDYNHAEDFSNLAIAQLKEVLKRKESILYPIDLDDLGHFLMSHPSIYKDLANNTKEKDLYAYLSSKLAILPKKNTQNLKADLYYQKYMKIKNQTGQEINNFEI